MATEKVSASDVVAPIVPYNEEVANAKNAKDFVTTLKKKGISPNHFFSDYATDEIIPKWCFADTVVTIFVLPPLVLLLIPFCVIYQILIFPVICLCSLYTKCLKKPVRRLEGCGFQLFCLFLLPIATPAIIVIWIWAFIGWFLSFFLSMPFGILRIIFLCQGPAILNNFRLIWKYSSITPFYYWSDICRAVIGCVYRQGILEYMSPSKIVQGGSSGFLTSVVVKYALTVNPWIYTLEEQYCNQWSPPIHGDPEVVGQALLDMVSQALPVSSERDEIDRSRFAPHYPYPPQTSRRFSIGSQFGESLKYPTFVKTTFKVDLSEIPEERRKDMDRNMYFVELSYTNPFHFLTGDVYVGRRKDIRWEHPMYCVQPKNGWYGAYFYGGVNELFRIFAPVDVTFWVEKHAPGEQVTQPIV